MLDVAIGHNQRIGPVQITQAGRFKIFGREIHHNKIEVALKELQDAVRFHDAVLARIENAAKLAVPTAVIVGVQDRITPPDNVRRVFAALPESSRHSYREIENAGHAVCQEQASEIARAIAEFADHEANAHA